MFTKTQAARGEMTFQSVCAACHVTQDFQGTSFIRTWAGRTAGDIFELISITMPMDDPGSLRPEDYADLVAYFFHLNGYPAGQAELSPSANRLRDVQIVAAPTSKPR